MNATEFRQWYCEHRAAYPGIDAWMGRMAKSSDGTDAVKSVDVLRQWHRVLEDVTFAEACEATRAMMRGDVEEPRSFEGHPKTIRRFVFDGRGVQRREDATARRHFVGGEETYQCGVCQDRGYVEVFMRSVVRAWRQGKEFPPDRKAFPYTVAASCTCRPLAEWLKRYQVYDAKVDIVVEFPSTTEQKCNQLREAVTAVQAGETFNPDAWA